ncbi:MAG: hypothetical protein AABX17_02000 [Nanoarchaeota archaeon]
MFLLRKQRIKSKKAFDLPFSWIFAIIAGAFIILISIYVTTKFIGTGKQYDYAATAKSISNLLDSTVNGLATTTAIQPIDFKKETRIYLDCEVSHYQSPFFGRQTIGFSEESGLIKKWSAPENNISRYNQYVFGKIVMQSKKYFIFSKPFYTGYKVADLAYIIPESNKYCIIRAPENVEYELGALSFSNINFTTTINSCPKDSVPICFNFNDGKCGIKIDYEDEDYRIGRVTKDGATLEYSSTGLLYAAIFSSPEIYGCNIARLGNKIHLLGEVYRDKVELVKVKECGSLIEPYLNSIIEQSNNLTPIKLGNLLEEAKLMDEKNCESNCPIYSTETCA